LEALFIDDFLETLRRLFRDIEQPFVPHYELLSAGVEAVEVETAPGALARLGAGEDALETSR
jgi:hypothetical protein